MEGITYLEHFIDNHIQLFNYLKETVHWDTRMFSRKTASFGQAYNYSQIHYPYQEFPSELIKLIKDIHLTIGFKPNNCLINYYLDGTSKMGYHSDNTDILVKNTGVVILSLGATRTLKFRNINNPELIKSYDLPSGSLIYMTDEIQHKWQHAIPKSNTAKRRMSLTFRQLIE